MTLWQDTLTNMKRNLIAVLGLVFTLGTLISTGGQSQAENPIPVTASPLISRGEWICAIQESGSARCWGNKDQFQVDFPNDMGKLVQISQGGYGSYCVVNEAGAFKCKAGEDLLPPLNDPGKVRQAASSGTAVCVLKFDFHVECWGKEGDIYNSGIAPSDLGNVKQIVAGWNYFCALTDGGLVRCWGANYAKQLEVPENIGIVTYLAAGDDATCAVTQLRKVICWGRVSISQTLTELEDVHYVALESSSSGNRNNVCVVYGWQRNVKCEFMSGQWEPFSKYEPVAQITFSNSFICGVMGKTQTVQCSKQFGGQNETYYVPSDLGKVKRLTFSLQPQPQPLIALSGGSGNLINISLGDWQASRNAQGFWPDLFVSYQWLRDGKEIGGLGGPWGNNGGETQPYSPVLLDLGRSISAKVTGSKWGYDSITVYSNKVTIRKISIANSPCGIGKTQLLSASLDSNTNKPTVAGKNYPGQSLTGSLGKWDKGMTTCSFWMVGEKAFPNLKSVSYKIQKWDVGKEITLYVVGTKNNTRTIRISAAVVVRASGK